MCNSAGVSVKKRCATAFIGSKANKPHNRAIIFTFFMYVNMFVMSNYLFNMMSFCAFEAFELPSLLTSTR